MAPRDYPRKIFVESSILFQLGPRLENVEFAKLLESGKSLAFEILISEVSWREYLRERKRDVESHMESIRAIQRALDKHGKSIPEHGDALEKTKAYLQNIDAHYRVRAAGRGIEIIPTPEIDVRRLLTMSIECIPPFEDPDSRTKEKGFRDSLIMFSILENVRGRPEANALVITNDALLARGLELHAEEYETSLHTVSSLLEAVELIGNATSEAERERVRNETVRAIDMLMRYREQIESKVREIQELSDWDLGQHYLANLLGTDKPTYVDIRSLESVSFQKVTAAVWMDRDKVASRILFTCLCNANVVANAPHLRVFNDESRRHKVGQPSSPFGGILLSSFNTPTEKKALPFYMYGEADLNSDGPTWTLQSLKLDKSPPSEEELDALREAHDASAT